MQNIEGQALATYTRTIPLWLRYVDDTFTAVHKDEIDQKKKILPPRRVSPFLAWNDFHARSRFARSTIPEDKWGTTRNLSRDL